MVRDGRGLDDPVSDNLRADELQELWIQVPESSPAVETTPHQQALCEVPTPCVSMHVRAVYLCARAHTYIHARFYILLRFLQTGEGHTIRLFLHQAY